MRKIITLCVFAAATVALADVLFRQGATKLGPVSSVACGAGISCARDAGVGVITGCCPTPPTPPDGGSCTVATVLANHALVPIPSNTCNPTTGVGADYLSGSGYIWIDGGANVNWSHDLTCAYGYALTTSGPSAMSCTPIVYYAASLTSDPANCGAGTAAGGIGATGVAESCVGSSGTPIDYSYYATYSTYLLNNGANCGAGEAARGVDQLGGSESCIGSSGTPISYSSYATQLVANGANCTAGNYPLGVDQYGAVEICTALPAPPDPATATPIAINDATAAMGTGTKYAREDHDHAHGDITAGSSMHQIVSTGTPTNGFMTPEMLTILNNLAADMVVTCAATGGCAHF